jgi:hypothetical protein
LATVIALAVLVGEGAIAYTKKRSRCKLLEATIIDANLNQIDQDLSNCSWHNPSPALI